MLKGLMLAMKLKLGFWMDEEEEELKRELSDEIAFPPTVDDGNT